MSYIKLMRFLDRSPTNSRGEPPMPTDPESVLSPEEAERRRPLGAIEQTGSPPGGLIAERYKHIGHRLDAKYERLRRLLYGPPKSRD